MKHVSTKRRSNLYSRFKKLGVFLPFAGILLVAACSDNGKPSNYIHDWSNWKTTTTAELNYPIPGHMDNYREIYINDIGTTVKVSTVDGRVRYDYPAGTIIAKEVYNGQNHVEGDKPKQVTAMVKAPDDPRAQGGWLWIAKDMESGTETILTDEFCITCHANANENHPYGDLNTNGDFRDYVYFPYDANKTVSGK